MLFGQQQQQNTNSSGGWGGERAGGGGRGRGFFRGGRGRNSGSFQGSAGAQTTSGPGSLQSTLRLGGINATYDICRFFVRNGECRNGDNCRFSHDTVVVALNITTPSPKAIKSIGSLRFPDGLKVLTGTAESGVKVWNFNSKDPTLETTIPTLGPVEHIDINDNTITWATNEPLSAEQPKILVGMLHLLNNTTLSTVSAKRSDEFPYSHPLKIRSFTTARVGGALYIVSGGGEGNIRIWRFDEAKNSFDCVSLLEGHLREVTGLLLVNESSYLWSSSADHTIRVWEMSSGKCVGVLSNATGQGHNDVVTCLELIVATSPTQPEPFIASGCGDGEVKIWRPNGEFAASCPHQGQFVTCLRAFQDELGGSQILLIGMLDGGIVARSCTTMAVLFVIDPSVCSTQSVWTIASLGQSCFATGGDDGNLIVWQVLKALDKH